MTPACAQGVFAPFAPGMDIRTARKTHNAGEKYKKNILLPSGSEMSYLFETLRKPKKTNYHFIKDL